MRKKLTGSCFCESVTFTVKDDFQHFFFCHCEQCQKMTGTAHASNLFTAPDNIQWTAGEDKLKRYDHPTRTFTKVFCTECGSGLPYVSQSGKFLIVPVGTLDDEPTKQLDAQIFCAEQANWYKSSVIAVKLEGSPE